MAVSILFRMEMLLEESHHGTVSEMRNLDRSIRKVDRSVRNVDRSIRQMHVIYTYM
jgi:hypothetical protein